MQLEPVVAQVLAGAVHGDAGVIERIAVAVGDDQVDALLAKSWQKHQIKPNALVDDATFLRRVYLTVVGRIPTLDEARGFYACQMPDKRAKLIDSLLASEGYVQNFFNYWADVLRAQSQGVAGSTTSLNYLNYLRAALRENKPYDQIARELVSSEGSCFDTGAIGYYMRDRGMPLDNLSNTTRIFLGTRMECAQCHDHPFDKWTQKQFYEMAAFTHNMSASSYRSKSGDEVQKMIRNDKSLDNDTRDLMRQALNEATRSLRDTLVVQNKGQLRLPHDYKYKDAKPKDVVQASVMFGKPVALQKESNTIGEFGQWLTSPENPRFTTIIANRLWQRVFGAGLYEQVDEMMDSSVASNPELMHFLERQMVALKYDMKAYLRVLYNTQAYQNEVTRTEPVLGEVYHFPGPVLRRMTAEQIYDSFVTLIHPTPDLPRRKGIDAEMAQKIVYRGKLSDALDLLTPQEIFDGAAKASEGYEAVSARSTPLREAYTAAQKAKDKPLIEKLNLEIRSVEFVARSKLGGRAHRHHLLPPQGAVGHLPGGVF